MHLIFLKNPAGVSAPDKGLKEMELFVSHIPAHENRYLNIIDRMQKVLFFMPTDKLLLFICSGDLRSWKTL